MDNYKGLAAGIIEQAADDLGKTERDLDRCRKKIKEYEFTMDPRADDEYRKISRLNSEKSRILKFFDSEWCHDLCEFIGMDGEYLAEKIKNRNISGK